MACLLLTTLASRADNSTMPWDNGPLQVSANHRFLQHQNGTPFFWQGETGWLLPERLDRAEAQWYLQRCHEEGYNVVQIQVIDGVPAYNVYGQPSHTDGWDFSATGRPGVYGYWDHLDHIVGLARQNGIYIAMVCIWGGLVKDGLLSTDDARRYGTFLANRYKSYPNIIWMMGGDIEGNIRPEVWDTLATTIKSIDTGHLMTYHPRGRHTSARWWAQAPWIDFHTFQSGHRRYGQRMGNATYPIPDNTEEDNWMYVDSTWAYKPLKPVLDAEPSYEGIPMGLHDPGEPRWQACDVRRYAYWSVFAGSCGHTYGNNAIMQMLKPGYPTSYGDAGDVKTWYQALHDPGFSQMKHLSRLMRALPYFERVPDQRIVLDNGTRYDRLIATRGTDYLLVYNYTSRPMRLDLTRISGRTKHVWWMDAATGSLRYLGQHDSRVTTFQVPKTTAGIEDGVLIAIDAAKDYLGIASSLPATTATAKVSVTDLRAERLVSPMSLDTPTPRLGWRIEAAENDVRQTRCHIIVASTPQRAEALQGDLWDATIADSCSQWVTYQGQPLRSDTRCYWRVQVTTNKGTTAWSPTAMWNVGLLSESDWQGRWIGLDRAMPWDEETEHSRLSARYLRHEFSLDRQVSHATLYICGLGLYEAFINGRRIGTQVLAPAPTDYRRTVLYNAFDVTSLLDSVNAIGVVLGNGRYYTMQQNKKPYKITRFGYPTLRLNLVVTMTDGTRQTIATDERWRLTPDGPIRSNNEYDGETYDARKEMQGWTLPGYDDTRWMQAERTAIPYGTLCGAMSENMQVVRELQPLSVSQRDGKTIVDMGQNMAGWLCVRIPSASPGDSVVIRFAERLDSAGNIWTDNLRHAQSTDRYVCSGREHHTWWHPTFVYHGFRYAEVSGLPQSTAADFLGQVVSDAMEQTGRFVSADTILNQVFRNASWGILSNYKGMPIDCPQRDERQPWLGDRTRGCYGEAFLFANDRLYAKWMRDICESQRADGCIPDVAPAFWNYYSDNVTWPAALPFGLDMLARHYGDSAPMRQCWPHLKQWMLHLKEQYQRDGLICRDRYGDWCVPPESETLIHSQDSSRITDGTLISTAYYYRLCQLMADAAVQHGIGDTEARRHFLSEAALTRTAFNRRFLHVSPGTSPVPGHLLYPDSTFYDNNTVTANLLPYVFGMTDDPYVRHEVEKNIVRAITSQNLGTVTCGVIGIGWLMHGLTRMGRSDLAWLLATNKRYPSWGYMAQHGATTIWELWNGDTASPRMNSGNHVMLLGDLLSWLYEDVAGIRAAAPGFRQVWLQPDFSVDEINHIDASYTSIYGPIVSRWEKHDGTLSWHVELPPNTSGTAVMPDGSRRPLTSGRHDLTAPLPHRHPSVVCDEFLYEQAPFPECHSASLVETRQGDLVCTYFGGTKERNPDVCIWVSRKPRGSRQWTAPQMVADGVFSSQRREACWNPVIFETPDGLLHIYFKTGPNVAGWKGWRIHSTDGGATWSPREALPDSIYGPIKNKPVIQGTRLISPTSDERNGWRCYFELSDDMGQTWRRTAFVQSDSGVKAIQPTIITLPDGRLRALCRTRSRQIGITESLDGGLTWSKLQLSALPNNNSGIDAVTLTDGSHALVCNDWPIEPDKEKGVRTPLSILRSTDGQHFHHWVTLEDSPILQYSYPSIIQTRDGHLHAVYTWRRQRIKHVELIPDNP